MTTKEHPTPAELATTYFEAWKARDETALLQILAEDCTFEGPLATLDNAADCVRGLIGMAEIITDIVVNKRLSDDNDVITWFDLHTRVAGPSATANWTHAEHGQITAIKVTFDPRELLAAS